MKSNILVKIIAGGAIVALLLVVISKRHSRNQMDSAALENEPASPARISFELTEVESGPVEPDNGLGTGIIDEKEIIQEYGVDVDSPVETMKTLTEETKSVRADSLALQELIKQQSAEVDRLTKMEEAINKRIEGRLAASDKEAALMQQDLNDTQSHTQQLIQQLEQRLESLQTLGAKKGAMTANGYEIGAAEIPAGLGYDENGAAVNFDEVVWIQPLGVEPNPRDPSGLSMPDYNVAYNQNTGSSQSSYGSGGSPYSGNNNNGARTEAKEDSIVRAYTIPSNATLLGSVSMTAIVGRIPANGAVTDPYPFKIMVGEENLSSNGIKIPGVVGIKMSGVAKGDWTLSCVSGEINSMTFTFEDGTIVSVPKAGEKASRAIAWFSDRNGIPCVPGKRITNAISFLGQRIALSTATAYADARAKSEITTETNGSGGVTSSVTGDPNVVAQNTAIGEGLGEASDWLNKRQANSFDAVYVPPGTEVAVHISSEIQIDYDKNGRKVNHHADIFHHTNHHLD